jgi:alpha-tubulin suppressor-like RCC1 family protein
MRRALVLALLAAAAGCYRPRAVDCVLACSPSGGCPDGLACSSGYCTRGPSCVPEIAAGARHTCAVRAGAVTCWGHNGYGQLGIGSTEGRGADATPFVAVSPAMGTAVSLAAGGRHTCALLSLSAGGAAAGANVACWGDNAFGQLGVADGQPRGTAADNPPVSVPLTQGANAITAGLAHTCALLADASVACWGDNRFGQLGVAVGAGGAGFTPVALPEKATAVAAGAYHTCALLESGAVRCWGWDDYGQLGDATLASAGTAGPGTTVDVPLPGGERAAAIATGGFHSCAVLRSGAVTCWGQNDAGQVGVVIDPNYRALPPAALVDLGRGRRASRVVAGASHTCALLDDFSVKCWGLNLEGELGVGDDTNRGGVDGSLGDALPRVQLGAGPVSRLTAGANHTCVVQAAAVECWGGNVDGELGVGDTITRGDDPAYPITPVKF